MTKPITSGPYRTFRNLNEYESFLEYEASTITIPISCREPNGPWLSEDVKLKAFMRLEIYPPYVNGLGTREFQFTIRDWDLYGSSPMLNQVFYGDPRGRLTEIVQNGVRIVDYVPVSILFRVSPNLSIEVDSDQVTACELFAPPNDLEIRNLTSHAFRNWVKGDEFDKPWMYTQPGNRIYWEALSGAATQALAQRAKGRNVPIDGFLTAGAPMILFHKKNPNQRAFDVTEDEDRANYLLAVANLRDQKGDGDLSFVAVDDVRGFAGNISQINGNTVLSSLSRQQEPLEIRWKLARTFKDFKQFDEFLTSRSLDKDLPRLSGAIRVVSPARSLGTAEQRPDVGDPFDSADFPVRITYAINYDIFLNRERFVADQAGIAIAVGALEIPPRDVKVAFEKPHMADVLGMACVFRGGGCCIGMHEITPEEYAAGVNFARYWRTMPLAPDDPGWNRFAAFDRSFRY